MKLNSQYALQCTYKRLRDLRMPQHQAGMPLFCLCVERQLSKSLVHQLQTGKLIKGIATVQVVGTVCGRLRNEQSSQKCNSVGCHFEGWSNFPNAVSKSFRRLP